MLECRLEILSLTPHQNILHIWICSPMNGGQYNDVLSNDTYLVAVVRELTTWYLAGGSLGLICIMPILSYNSFSKLSFKILYFQRVEITPKYYKLARYVALGETQQSRNNRNHHPSEWMALNSCLSISSQVLKAFRNDDEILPYIPCLETQIVHNRGHG
jgi:hypothetical protein